MGLFERLFGRRKQPKQVVPAMSEDERAAQHAKYVDNVVEGIRDEMNRFPGWIASRYAAGAVPEFDNSRIGLERVKIEETIEQIIAKLRELVPEEAAQAKIDKMKAEATERALALLRLIPSGGISAQP